MKQLVMTLKENKEKWVYFIEITPEMLWQFMQMQNRKIYDKLNVVFEFLDI